jgi:hypothetical protein
LTADRKKGRGDFQADEKVTRKTNRLVRPHALLQSHSEGLSAEELRVYLKSEKPIGDTLQGMVRTGKLRGVDSGQQKKYSLA